jgi:thiol-disulfide isomerase/thioredoxin
MRKLLFFFTCLVIFYSTGCTTRTKDGFNLSGKFLNVKTGTKISLEQISTMPPTVTDTTTLNSDGSFDIHGYVKEEAVYTLRYDNNRIIYLVLDNKPTDIHIEADTLDPSVKPYVIKGSPKTSSLYAFMYNIQDRIKGLRPLFAKADSSSNISDSLKLAARKEIEAKKKSAYDYIVQFCDTTSSAPLSIFIAKTYLGSSITTLNMISSNLTQRFPQSIAVKNFATELEKLIADSETKQLYKEGQILPDIAAQGIDGNEKKLSSLRGQYVLVDFWASWCGPCRGENPNVVNMYNKYKNKGFNVFSISLDEDKDKWKQAIQQDKLAWPNHVSELKGWNSSFCNTFAIKSIPANYLIDKEGKVIAFNLRGDSLESRLKGIFK